MPVSVAATPYRTVVIRMDLLYIATYVTNYTAWNAIHVRMFRHVFRDNQAIEKEGARSSTWSWASMGHVDWVWVSLGAPSKCPVLCYSLYGNIYVCFPPVVVDIVGGTYDDSLSVWMVWLLDWVFVPTRLYICSSLAATLCWNYAKSKYKYFHEHYFHVYLC